MAYKNIYITSNVWDLHQLGPTNRNCFDSINSQSLRSSTITTEFRWWYVFCGFNCDIVCIIVLFQFQYFHFIFFFPILFFCFVESFAKRKSIFLDLCLPCFTRWIILNSACYSFSSLHPKLDAVYNSTVFFFAHDHIGFFKFLNYARPMHNIENVVTVFTMLIIRLQTIH